MEQEKTHILYKEREKKLYSSITDSPGSIYIICMIKNLDRWKNHHHHHLDRSFPGQIPSDLPAPEPSNRHPASIEPFFTPFPLVSSPADFWPAVVPWRRCSTTTRSAMARRPHVLCRSPPQRSCPCFVGGGAGGGGHTGAGDYRLQQDPPPGYLCGGSGHHPTHNAASSPAAYSAPQPWAPITSAWPLSAANCGTREGRHCWSYGRGWARATGIGWELRVRCTAMTSRCQVPEESQLVFRTPASSLECSCFINDSGFLSGSNDGSIVLWGIIRKKPTFIIKNAHPPLPVDRLHNKEHGGIPNGDITENGSCLTQSSAAHLWVSSVAVCRGSDLAASGAANGVVRLWSFESDDRSIGPLFEYPLVGFVNSLAFAKSGRFLLAGAGQNPLIAHLKASKKF